MTIQKHRFEIFTPVSEIHENVYLVIGMKNLDELEGVIDSQDSCVSFSKHVNTFLSKGKGFCKTKGTKKKKIDIP